jgi:RHS repeat-associated protein
MGVLGLTTTITDQAGVKRTQVHDALGRLINVWELDPTTGSLLIETAYQYNARGNLLRVDQKGGTSDTSKWRTRTFTYDSLSRLLTANNPESGAISWMYDNDSNVLTKTDARGITINYSPSDSPIDALHRVRKKTYSNGDPAVSYYYDQTSYNGLVITEGIGQRTGMSDSTGTAAWTFDTEGRALAEQKMVNIAGLTSTAITKTISYTYNLDGSIKSLTYPSAHRVDYAYNDAGRALSGVDSIDSQNVTKYVTSATYAPHGEVASLVNGEVSPGTGIKTSNTWNNRFQPQTFTATRLGADGDAVLSLHFGFNLGTQSAPINSGLLVRISNGLHPERSTNYKYDRLNRIQAGWHDATDWGVKYTVDVWGNLSEKAACDCAVCPGRTLADSFSTAVNGNNQFVGYSYDVSGNLLNDQLGHSYSYDSENRPYSASGVNYYYDGDGERVAKSSGRLYLFGTGSAPVVETDASGNTTAEYVFFGGKRVALRKPDGSVHYYFADQIGSANVVTNATGTTVEQDIEYHPYGEQQVYTDNLGQQYRFTGKEHDTETNNDYFGARYYSSTFGRFLTPDWAATPVPVPYAQLENPQTLNLYSYVENNPTTGTDPDGHATGQTSNGCSISCDDAMADRRDAEMRADSAKAMLDRAWNAGMQAFDFAQGFGKGVGASLSWGSVDAWNPKPTDSVADRAGQISGTAVVGGLGTSGVKGGTATAIGACATGVGCPTVGLGGAAVATGGAVMAAGAARNSVALMMTTPVQGGTGGTNASTGRTAPKNLKEKLAMEQAKSNPKAGMAVPLKKGMTDPRWPGSQGWVKMSQNVNGVEVHYVRNTKTGAVADFKFAK